MFKKMTVGTKLIAGFMAVCLMGAIVAAIGIVNMSKLNEKADQLYKMELLGLSYIKEANINLIYIGRARGNALLATSEEERKQSADNIKKYQAAVRENLEKARPLFVLERAKVLFAQYASVSEQYEKELWKGLSLASAESLQVRSEELTAVLAEARQHANVMDAVLTELSGMKEKRAQEAAAETTALYENSRMLMILLVLGSAIAGVGLGALITRGLTRQLGGEPDYAAQVAASIASGDLTVAVNTRQGDSSSLLFAMKAMRDSLVSIVGQVRSGTDTIATASGQIAAGSQDLSSRTEEQASSLEETASSMEELTSTVKANADNARQANALASSASDVALKGGTVVSEVVQTMSAINDSSKKIVDIIGVIDGIAFQTNILALNAAVEAARAGEQGRGFAVVASEVRNLAQRSAAAAKEIKVLIGDSVEKVDVGAKLVDQAGVTMQEIVDSVRRVTDIMGEIQAASDEQSAGIDQINQAITQMDEVTQQNAALVEESAAASEAMQVQARTLSEVVSVFKLDGMLRSEPQQSPSRPVAAGKPSRLPAPRRTQPAIQKTARRPAPKPETQGDEWEQF